MLTSLNAFGGLSAAELLRLFGSNSPSSAPSSSATSTSPAQSASPAVSAADANDPLKKIKSILASAQMAQFSTAPSAGESVSGALVTAAYAEQTGSGYALSFDGSNGSAVWGGGERTFAAQIQTGTSAAKSAADIAGISFQASGFYSGDGVPGDSVSFGSSVIAASISAVSTAQASNGATSSLAAAQTDAFYLSDSVGAQSAAVTFEVAGLGQPQAVPTLDWTSGNAVCSVGQGDLMETFSISVQNGDSTQTTSLTIGGLDTEQAQQLGSSFENATPTPSGYQAVAQTKAGAGAPSGSLWFAYALSDYSGASVTYRAQTSSGWTPAGQQTQV